MKILALFDVDHTLVRGSGAQKQSFSVAIHEVFGIEARMEDIDYQGKTDQMILVDVLKHHGIDETLIKDNLPRLMHIMESVYSRLVNDDTVIVLDGVRELLDELINRPVLTGLVTGNLGLIARQKLRRAGLDHNFPHTFYLRNIKGEWEFNPRPDIGIGGFGSDDINRSTLVRLAIKRAHEQVGFVSKDSNVLLFGDTPRDISAGQEVGVVTVGVGTGRFSREDLLAAGADHAFDNLADTNHILSTLFEGQV